MLLMRKRGKMCMLSSKLKKCFGLSMLIFILMLAFSVPAFAEDSDANVVSDGEYTIDSYNVNVNVGLNNVLDVTENINADFFSPKHGIYRYIPVICSTTRYTNGEYVDRNYRSIISDISVKDGQTGQDVYYKQGRSHNNLELKIGDKDETFTGKKSYSIHYKYDIGEDGIKQFDELYYNIIGTGWDTQISNVTFSVTMPKPFDEKKLGFTSGYEGSADSSNVKYSVEGNTITGSVNGTLLPNQGLTVRLELPNGYFANARKNSSSAYITFFIFMLIMIALSYLLFYLFGRDDNVYETVEFYPPEGITSAEAGYIIDGSVDNRDIVSLIIYWAGKGYLDIVNESGNDFTLTKRKNDDDSMKIYEQYMFQKLFEFNDTVTADDLKYKFYNTVSFTKSQLKKFYKKDSDNRIFTSSGNTAQRFSYVFAGLCIMPVIYKSILNFTFSYSEALFDSVLASILIYILSATLGNGIQRYNSDGIKVLIRYSLPYIIVMFIITCFNINYTELIILSIFSTISSGLCTVIGGFAKKRTKYSNEMLGKLLGLKKFIEFAEKDRINALVAENPSYFYSILPYAYVLGVTDKWAKKFEGIAMQPPSWYYSESDFDSVRFCYLIDSNMDDFQRNMIATQSSNSNGSGDFGGGGFSGGGSGGGGGGSW